MRSQDEVELVRILAAEGMGDAEIARRCGIPRSTVRDWRAGRRAERRTNCPWCDREPLLGEADYSYLLGLYLGDGCLARVGRVWQLRI